MVGENKRQKASGCRVSGKSKMACELGFESAHAPREAATKTQANKVEKDKASARCHAHTHRLVQAIEGSFGLSNFL